ncbi:MAG: tRNA (N6-isopentenyl adenosine(37)-C2)-methylthiotransferase MiaB [Flavobacteriales bacterium]|jgi:tRNA-2-methylthio-N6-dimethylallyladenosine synthase|nr:tRNA (N6-isopentenyl adenosine(37)-C2)-methylthiotransferase MiaB [Flavobacteriales bacterium]
MTDNNHENIQLDESQQGQATVVSDQEGHKKLYIESYGCQMNFSDSEIVASILNKEGYVTTRNIEEADLVFVNTCSIREKAEQTVRKRLSTFQKLKKNNPGLKVGVLGCMAERLKDKFLEEEKIVDLVVGPDAYRALPTLLGDLDDGKKAVNVLLSMEETYADISPVRLSTNGVSAFVSIMRGCDNMCSFCVVPFTRGRERSRDPESILKEISELSEKGFKEVTLLGQNIDSYLWYGGGPKKHFKKLSEIEKATSTNFGQLLEKAAKTAPNMRIRFTTSNPQDMTDDVLEAMANNHNICKFIHLPFQSGNDRILKLMNRGYTNAEYRERIDAIRKIVPDCALSHDIITGFCTETEEEHQDTLKLMEYVKFDFGYMFAYSERPNTLAEKKMEDDIPKETKKKRLTEIIDLQQKHSLANNQARIGKVQEVLVEGVSKRSEEHLFGRNSQNTVIVFPKEQYKKGDFINVKIEDCTSATLKGTAVGFSKMQELQ